MYKLIVNFKSVFLTTDIYIVLSTTGYKQNKTKFWKVYIPDLISVANSLLGFFVLKIKDKKIKKVNLRRK